MRPIGCSTGAIALGDFSSALGTLRDQKIPVVEVSLLRETELKPFVHFLDTDDSRILMENFSFVSIHAPKSFCDISEEKVVDILTPMFERSWPIVVHADSITRFDCWARFGDLLCIENMDSRKHTGRTAQELENVFRELPEASFCFDVGHARQIDRTMTRAEEMMRTFGDRVKILHVSDVSVSGEHQPLSRMAMMSYSNIARMVPEDVPVVIESPVKPDQIANEVCRVQQSLDSKCHSLLVG